MPEIPLTQGQVALVDEADLKLVQGHKWHALRRSDGAGWYAARSLSRRAGRGYEYMHRLLLPGVPRVDHRDGDGLNNQRVNLRPCTQTQNMANQRKQHRVTTSHFKGVSWSPRERRWRAYIGHLGRFIDLGNHVSEIDAARAYNTAAFRLYGEFARPNVIEG